MPSQESQLGFTLSNSIHPLFKHHNFRASALTPSTTGTSTQEPVLPLQTYNRLIPALRLASNLLDFSLPFLAKVTFAPLVFPSFPNAPPTYYAFQPDFQPTDAHIQRIRSKLTAWANRTRFYCKTPGTIACNNKAHTEVRTSNGQAPPSTAYTLTTIAQETIAFFSRKDYDKLPIDIRTAQLVELAFVLVHEQAHATFHCRWAEDKEMDAKTRAFIRQVSPQEPMYHTQFEPKYDELGFAWSAWVHGGSVLSQGHGLGDMAFVQYPSDVFQGAVTTAQRYPFREMLLSEEFWTFVRSAGSAPAQWNVESSQLGWLGQMMTYYNK